MSCRVGGKGFIHPTQQSVQDRLVERAYKVLLSDKNLLVLIDNPKSFIIPVFSCLAASSLVLGEYFVLKDLFFYEVTHLADSEAHQDSLEEQERNCQEGTLRQASTTGRLSSNSAIRPPTQKKKEPAANTVWRARTPPFASLSSSLASSSPSFSSSSDELATRVGRIVPLIICKEEEEKNMDSNLRAGFREKEHKCSSESIVVNYIPSKKAYPKPVLAPLPMPISLATALVVTPNSDEKPPSTDDISYHEMRKPFVVPENLNKESFECMTSSPLHSKLAYVPNQEEISEILKRISSFTEREPPI